jgi:hypothetical protein
MRNKFTSLALMAALVATLCTTSTFANTRSDSGLETIRTETSSTSIPATTKEAGENEKLRAVVLKLVADAKAGKIVPAERPQIQPAKSNNLSKGTKIAIGVGIVVAVIAVIVIAKSPILHDGQ